MNRPLGASGASRCRDLRAVDRALVEALRVEGALRSWRALASTSRATVDPDMSRGTASATAIGQGGGDAPRGKLLRVAWYHQVVPHYRVPAINGLAARPTIELTIAAGQEFPGVSHPDASDALDTPVIRLRNLWGKRGNPKVTYSLGVTRVLLSRPDVMIIGESSKNLVHWLCLGLRPLFGYRLVIIGHIRLSRRGEGLGSKLRKKLVRSADGVIAYGEAGVEQALAWGVSPSAVVAMGNAIYAERVAAARAAVEAVDVTALRRELDLTGPVFVFIARPTPWKRLDVAIETMRLLAARGVDAHMLVIGGGAGLPRHMAQAADLKSVRFLGSITDEHALAPYFAIADLVFIPGAVGLAVNHAFAYGLPLVTAANVPHGPEMAIARHGRNAVIVKSCDARLFAAELESLARSPDRLRALQGGAESTNVPTLADMVDNIEALILRVATRGPSQA